MSLPVTRQHLPRHPHDTQESGGSGLSLLPPEHVCPIGIALRRVQARLCSAVVGGVLRMRRRSDLTAARPDKTGFEYLGADHAHAEHARATDLDVTPTSEATSFARPRSGLVGRRAKQDHGARDRLDGLILSSSGCSGTAVLSRRGLVVAHGSELLSARQQRILVIGVVRREIHPLDMLQPGISLREVHPLDTLQLRRLLLALGHVDEDGRPLRLARGPRIAAAAGRLRALLRRGRYLRRRRSAQLDERLGRSGEGRHAAPPQRCDSTMISFSPRMASSAS